MLDAKLELTLPAVSEPVKLDEEENSFSSLDAQLVNEAQSVGEQVTSYTNKLLTIKSRGKRRPNFEEDVLEKQAIIAELEEQARDAKVRGQPAEVKRLKNKISAYKSRMKQRTREHNLKMMQQSGPSIKLDRITEILK